MQEISQNKSLIKRNISKYLAEHRISKYKFYKVSGMSRGTLDNASGLTEENIQKFLGFARDVNIDWLFTGKGEMLKSPPETSEYDQLMEDTKRSHEEAGQYLASRIPVYNVRNPKAVTALFENSESTPVSDYLQIPNIENCDGALFVPGDNMDPLMKSGDIIAYKVMKDKSDSWFWGNIYILVITIEDEQMTLLNYVQKSEKGDAYISLTSFNPIHQQKDIHRDQVIAFALVKASIRMNV